MLLGFNKHYIFIALDLKNEWFDNAGKGELNVGYNTSVPVNVPPEQLVVLRKVTVT